MSNVLLTLGRMPKALDLARALKAQGCRVIIAEPFAWHLARVSRAVDRSYPVTAPSVSPHAYLDDLAGIVERERIDLVVPVSEEALHAAAVRGRLAEGVRVYSQDQSVLLALHDKLGFVGKARELGLDAPATFTLGSPEADALAARQDVIVKPRYSCGGIGVRSVPAGRPLPDRATDPTLVQARVEGEEYSTFSIADRGRTLVTSVYRGTIMSGTVAIAFERVLAQPAIETWVETFVERSGYSGFISFDFILDAAGAAHAIECNPRVTSGVQFLDPDDLAKAILEPQQVDSVGFRAERRLQQFFPCLTETQAAMIRGRRFRPYLRELRQARDVTWSRDDPWPFLLMTFTSYEILRRTIFHGMSFAEAATADIGWAGDEQAVNALR